MALTLEQLQGSFSDPYSQSNTVSSTPSVANYSMTSSPTSGQVAGASTSPSSPTNADWQTVWNNGYNNNGNYGAGGDWLTQAYQAGQTAYQAGQTGTGGTGGTGGQILGQQTTGGDWSSIFQSQYPGWDETAARADWTAKGSPTSFGGTSGGTQSILDQGYNEYFANLDNMLNSTLPAQQSAQNTIANESYNQGVNNLDLQKTQGMDTLAGQETQANTNQAKTLRDLSGNIRNSMMAGNVYLGARGAGDSSAANQYSYALTKLGSQQRGDVMNQTAQIMNDINGRKTNLQNIYNSETKKLESAKNSQIAQISQWFAEQQQSLMGMKASAALQKSQELYNTAISALQTTQSEISSRKSMLEQWAMNNATNINQLTQNMQQVGSPTYNLPTSQPIVGQPVTDAGGNISAPAAGYGTGTQEKKTSLFGAPVGYNADLQTQLGNQNLFGGY